LLKLGSSPKNSYSSLLLMSITLAFAVAQVSLYFNCSVLSLKPNYLDYFYYFMFVWYNHNPSINLFITSVTNSFTK